MEAIRKCKICGQPFVSKSRRNVICKDPNCKVENARISARESQRARKSAQARRSTPVIEGSTLAEINEKARAAGLSYGQYIAQQYNM